MKQLIEIVKGIFIGIANIIPGVSGGTLAVSMGVYNKIIDAVLRDTKSLFVSPKDIDKLIKKSAKIIADGINLALHKSIDFSFIENFIA